MGNYGERIAKYKAAKAAKTEQHHEQKSAAVHFHNLFVEKSALFTGALKRELEILKSELEAKDLVLRFEESGGCFLVVSIDNVRAEFSNNGADSIFLTIKDAHKIHELASHTFEAALNDEKTDMTFNGNTPEESASLSVNMFVDQLQAAAS